VLINRWRRAVTRRQLLGLIGGGAVIAGSGLLGADASQSGAAPAADPPGLPWYPLASTGYAPDGIAGAHAAYPLAQVRLLDSPFRANQARNLAYLNFLDPDRMLHTFRLNYGQPSAAQPVGGWEAPDMLVRGHTTGHLLSGLALSYANTGNAAAKATGEYLVGELAKLQALAPRSGYSPGYLSAFPEVIFDWLESGQYQRVWSPYYMIHKYLAGLIDQYQLAGVGQALDVATRLADWVDWRTAPLSYAHMQAVLNEEFGGLPESLANLYRITGTARYLSTAERFYHARFLDPLAAGEDPLNGQQCNVSLPKVISALRLWEETANPKYRDTAANFWRIATGDHLDVVGGMGNHEHWYPPGVIAGALSNFTAEGCVTYNMLKLTRLLHFADQSRTDLLDYYELALFNQMLGTQDPGSPHGFACYYTGLSAGAVKRQPLNYFPRGDPGVYSTDYETFTCDNATALETASKFADTIYSRDSRGVYVNLFIPSEVRCADQGLTLRQTTAFPDDPATRITVVRGAAPMTLRVRVPAWTAAPPTVLLNGQRLRNTVVPSPGTGTATDSRTGGWVTVTRHWRPGDWLEVTFPMTLRLTQTPDDPAVQAVTYGPVVLAGLAGTRSAVGSGDPKDATDQPPATLPPLDPASVSQAATAPLTFTATSAGRPVTMIPVARVRHQPYTVYWQTP
jgi:DUF1680 family protein